MILLAALRGCADCGQTFAALVRVVTELGQLSLVISVARPDTSSASLDSARVVAAVAGASFPTWQTAGQIRKRWEPPTKEWRRTFNPTT
jgi:hypothetical protein